MAAAANINDLPVEILSEIFSLTSMHDLFSIAQVSRSWNRISKDCYIWRRLDFSLAHRFFISHNCKSRSDLIELKAALRSKYQTSHNVVWILDSQLQKLQVVIVKSTPSHRILCHNQEFLKNIKSLSLESCGELMTRSDLETILQYLPKLEEVNLNKCSDLVDNDMLRSLLLDYDRGFYMKTLKLNSCSRLSSESMGLISRSCHNLKVLDISGISVSDELVALIFPQLPSILASSRSLFHLDSFDEVPVGRLVHTLEELYMNDMDFVTCVSMACLIRNLTKVPDTKLRKIAMNNNYHVSRRVLDQFYILQQQENMKRIGPVHRNKLAVEINRCPQLTLADLTQCQKSIHNETNFEVKFKHDIILKDNTEDAIREYLRDYVRAC